ncbi:cytochrome P450 [Boeremia exigua]|uniref:cytochrome P450 n=1 Tax=Boeremia exigua TaxID=749465 RepID=UPI001E8DD6B8|nr:cytochrome P450 [Boeremia exigua]KAH6643100.1 cytochrome P450 [Boeremia exigua]
MSLVPLAVVILLFFVSRAIYRLWLSPLAHIPGPKIAALTSWYCAYHDIVRGGQYVWIIEAMHQKYGPIVRIRPNVVHVNDPSFIEQLYPQSPHVRRERAQTVLNLFTKHLSVLPTKDHQLHRQRRAVLSRFFSQQNIRRLVPVINETLANLLHRMEGWARDGNPVSFNAAYKAATKDIIQVYALGDGQRCLEMEDLNAPFFDVLHSERLIHISVHFYWFTSLISKLPPRILVSLNPSILAFIGFVEDLTTKIEDIRQTDQEDNSNHTIFHEILRSDISPEQKTTPRLADEAMVITIAGADTTAATLVALTYHVLSDASIFRRLRRELESVMLSPDHAPDPKALDGLPFLNAVIEETLRLYPTGTHRQDRVAPDEVLVFTYPDGRKIHIPAGTIVGMTAPLINRHPAWFDDPEMFKPDRYLENPKLLRRHFTFSKGMRQCLGMNLAYQELQTITAGIFRKYSPYESNVTDQNGPTLELYETEIEDVKMYADYVTPGLRPGRHGLRIRVRHP